MKNGKREGERRKSKTLEWAKPIKNHTHTYCAYKYVCTQNVCKCSIQILNEVERVQPKKLTMPSKQTFALASKWIFKKFINIVIEITHANKQTNELHLSYLPFDRQMVRIVEYKLFWAIFLNIFVLRLFKLSIWIVTIPSSLYQWSIWKIHRNKIRSKWCGKTLPNPIVWYFQIYFNLI